MNNQQEEEFEQTYHAYNKTVEVFREFNLSAHSGIKVVILILIDLYRRDIINDDILDGFIKYIKTRAKKLGKETRVNDEDGKE